MSSRSGAGFSSDLTRRSIRRPRRRPGLLRVRARLDSGHFPRLGRRRGPPRIAGAARAVVLPALVVVLTDEAVVWPLCNAALVIHQSREHAVVVLSVLVVVADDGRRVGVIHHPGAKERVGVPAIADDDVTNDAAQERDI